MDKNRPDSGISDKIRQQFNQSPYPKAPLDFWEKNNSRTLYIYNLITSYYLRHQKVIQTEGKVILDAGCGSGYKSLLLAEANPGAKIVGIDISEESVKLAQQRLHYHGFKNTEFYALPIENLPELGIEFDYINADEVLYLLPNPLEGLRAMQSVLKPEGIIRANLHSSRQRVHYYRAQELFKMMGLMDGNPQHREIEIVRETMSDLKDEMLLKQTTWKPPFKTDDQRILMNYLFQGDKGYTIPEMFAALRAANLELISMVQWWQWDLMDLFKEPDDLPIFLGLSLPEATIEERLHLFELLHPIHRLLDFWCGHPNQAQSFMPVSEWALSNWQEARVHLHPQLKTPQLKEDVLNCVIQLKPLDMSQHLPFPDQFIFLDSTVAVCLLPLWQEPQSFDCLLERWQQLRGVDPVTLKPTTTEEALDSLVKALTRLESLACVLVEHQG